MKKWEYKSCNCKFKGLNEYGSDGWELVSVVYVQAFNEMRYYFKRELK